MHIGFIMDGNRRWATSKGLLKLIGHTKGFDNIENVLDLCLNEGIEYVSLWGIAKKNLQERGQDELNHLYSIIRNQFVSIVEKLIEKRVKFETIGDLDLLSPDLKEILIKAKNDTESGDKMTFIFAIGYGGQDEIVRGVKKFLKENIDKINSENIDAVLGSLDEKIFSNYLETGKYPPPDLIVRTGGDIRLSGYFLYQSEYSEYYFTPTYWPDFDENEFYKALNSLKNAKRNFGK